MATAGATRRSGVGLGLGGALGGRAQECLHLVGDLGFEGWPKCRESAARKRLREVSSATAVRAASTASASGIGAAGTPGRVESGEVEFVGDGSVIVMPASYTTRHGTEMRPAGRPAVAFGFIRGANLTQSPA